MNKETVSSFLEEKVLQYQQPQFIISDPIQIPYLFSKKEDIEISAFIAATLSWGNRKSILKSANAFMEFMDHAPHEFIINATENDYKSLSNFKHRTFNGEDARLFCQSLKNIYLNHGGLENVFFTDPDCSLQENISLFKTIFFNIPHPQRTTKHVSDPLKGSAAKRINMYLRWMVRDHSQKVDFGIWSKIKPSQLSCPLDVHSGRVARKLGLLNRKQNDGKAVTELDNSLRLLDPTDPVKYDFALFGLGVFEGF
tara:strand:- start:1796 stop:2557 length:762 start_codon:yes stop_codon:yes gene_type:complete